jgi:hypothetical protein
MAEPVIVKVIFLPDGTFTSKVINVKGPKCAEIVKPLDAVGTVTSDTKTPEYDERDNSQTAGIRLNG